MDMAVLHTHQWHPMEQMGGQWSLEAYYHTHYTVGGKCIHHQHIMDAGCTLREFDALK